MRSRIHTLQRALPFYYFLVLFLTFALLVSSFCIYYLKNLRASEYTNLQNLSRSVTTSLEQEIDKMSTVSLNAIYSKSITPQISELSNPDLSAQEIYGKQQDIYKAIFNIIGLQQNIVQVNIYPVNNKNMGSGLYTYHETGFLEDKDWFSDAVEEDGHRLMTVPHHLSYYMSRIPFSSDDYYISLVRLYYDNAHQVNGAVEVLQECSTFFSALYETILQNENINICIVNKNKDYIYPVLDSAHESALLYDDSFIEGSLSPQTVHLIEDSTSKRDAVIQTSIPSVGWNIYVSVPDTLITNSLVMPILVFAGILLIILLLTWGICNLISRRILLPLKQLQSTFEVIHLDDLFTPSSDPLPLPGSHYGEIKTLIDAFQHLYTKLNHSTTLMLQSREEEIKAKEIATQSLMKPHFLYNNFANISIMAEKHMNQEIVTLTENLCDYLRYTSASGTNRVSIKDEFFYTEKYLLCMKVRYMDRLNYSFSLDESAENITVPKLILQPLVENALKYAFFRNPPWVLNISSHCIGKKWYITIRDNGPGFSDEVQKAIFTNLKKIRITKDVSQLKIGGMGISNVYLRLLLMFEDSTVFNITNDIQGACVTIGGEIEDASKSL